MLNSLRLGRNVFNITKKTSKGGAGLPHNDPPTFKAIKNKRFNPLHDHLMWFKDSYEQQYYIILKHNQYKGLWGMFWNIFRYYVVGTLVPCFAYIYWKDIAHDQLNYYNAFYVESPTSPSYKRESNVHYKVDQIRNALMASGNKDFLGRRGSDYYHVLGNMNSDPTKQTAYEKSFREIQKRTVAGRI